MCGSFRAKTFFVAVKIFIAAKCKFSVRSAQITAQSPGFRLLIFGSYKTTTKQYSVGKKETYNGREIHGYPISAAAFFPTKMSTFLLFITSICIFWCYCIFAITKKFMSNM